MQKRVRYAVSIVASVMLLGCGGGSSSSEDLQTEVTSKKVSGTIYDGPVYEANIEIIDPAQDKVLAKSVSSKLQETVGDYVVEVANLPKVFIVKSIGGVDSGADGLINANDKKIDFPIKTVANANDGEELVVNVTPATTLVANIVEKQDVPNLDEAKDVVAVTLGLPKDVDIIKANPKEDPIAAKAASFVANVVDSLPAKDSEVVYEAVTEVFKEKAKNKEPIATINEDSVELKNDFSLKEIATTVATIDEKAISDIDIKKVEKVEDTLKTQIKSVVIKTKPVEKMDETEKIVAVAADKTLDVIKSKIDESIDDTTLVVNEINKIALNTEKTLSAVMINAAQKGEDALGLTEDKSLEILTTVIEENINKLDQIKVDTLTDVAIKAKEKVSELESVDSSDETKDVTVTILKNSFANIDLTNESSVESIDKIVVEDVVKISETIVEKSQDAVTIESAKDNFVESLSSVVASTLTTKLDGNTVNIEEVIAKSVENSDLIETIANAAEVKATVELKIENGEEVKASELSEVVANETVVSAISENFTNEEFVFDENVKQNFETIKESISTTLEQGFEQLQDGSADVDITTTIAAAETSASLVDVTSEDFSVEEFETVSQTIESALESVQETSGNVDILATVENIKDAIETAIDEGKDLTEAVQETSENVSEFVKEAVSIEDLEQQATTDANDIEQEIVQQIEEQQAEEPAVDQQTDEQQTDEQQTEEPAEDQQTGDQQTGEPTVYAPTYISLSGFKTCYEIGSSVSFSFSSNGTAPITFTTSNLTSPLTQNSNFIIASNIQAGTYSGTITASNSAGSNSTSFNFVVKENCEDEALNIPESGMPSIPSDTPSGYDATNGLTMTDYLPTDPNSLTESAPVGNDPIPTLPDDSDIATWITN